MSVEISKNPKKIKFVDIRNYDEQIELNDSNQIDYNNIQNQIDYYCSSLDTLSDDEIMEMDKNDLANCILGTLRPDGSSKYSSGNFEPKLGDFADFTLSKFYNDGEPNLVDRKIHSCLMFLKKNHQIFICYREGNPGDISTEIRVIRSAPTQ